MCTDKGDKVTLSWTTIGVYCRFIVYNTSHAVTLSWTTIGVYCRFIVYNTSHAVTLSWSTIGVYCLTVVSVCKVVSIDPRTTAHVFISCFCTSCFWREATRTGIKIFLDSAKELDTTNNMNALQQQPSSQNLLRFQNGGANGETLEQGGRNIPRIVSI